MTSYDRVLTILKGKTEDLDRIPCLCPGVGNYSIDFMREFDAWWPDAHKDPEKMAKLASAAYRMCGLESVVVPFDIVVEAEMLGMEPDFRERQAKRGKYLWPTIARPGVTRDGRIINEPYDLVVPDDIASAGRIPVITKALEILHEEFYGKVPIFAWVVAPVSSLPGYVMDAIRFYMWFRTAPEKIEAAYEILRPMDIELAKIYLEAGADVIAIREDSASCDSVSPKDFVNLIKPNLQEIFKGIKAPTFLTMSGTATPIIGPIVEIGANAVVLDEKTNMIEARKIVDSKKPAHTIALAGNVAPKDVLHQGPIERIRENVRFLIQKARVDMIAPGCDLWLQTPWQHVKAMVDATIEFGEMKK